MPDAAGIATLAEAGQKPQMLKALDTIGKRMFALGARLAEHIATVKAEFQKQLYRLETLFKLEAGKPL